MALIHWDESYSVSINEIDQQHQKLINMTNRLNEALLHGKGQAESEQILAELVDYSSYHFQTEERYFKEFDYPGAASHIKEHEKFIERVNNMNRKAKEGNPALFVELMTFLGNWIINHIQGTDFLYVDFFKQKGL